MIEEKRLELENHVSAIAAILYEYSKNREPEKLKTLEGIELEVREQVQKYVSREIGIFLLAQRQEQKQVESEN